MKLYKIALFAIVLSGCHLAKEVTRKNNLAIEANSCSVIDNPEYPYIIDWDGSEINNLMFSSRKGAVIVSYDSCRNIKILDECKFSGNYIETASSSPFTDVKLLSTKMEISSTLPFNISNILGRISDTSALEMKVLTLGNAEFVRSADAFELEGETRCLGATHYISKMDLGASSLSERRALQKEAGANILSFETNASTSSNNNVIIKRGNITVCNVTGFENKSCRVPLRIRLSNISNIIDKNRLAKRIAAQKQARLDRVIEEHLREVESRYLQILPFLKTGDEEAKSVLDRFESQYVNHPLGNPKLEEAKAIYLEAAREAARQRRMRAEHARKLIVRTRQSEEAIIASIRSKVKTRLHKLNSCYIAESTRNPNLSNVILRVHVEGSGILKNVTSLNEVSNIARRCFYRELRSLRVESFNGNDLILDFPLTRSENVPSSSHEILRRLQSNSTLRSIRKHQEYMARLPTIPPRSSILKEFRTNSSKFRYCERHNTSGATFKLIFRISVLQNGEVYSVELKDRILNKNSLLVSCLKNAFMTLRFPAYSRNEMLIFNFPIRISR